MYFQVDSSSGIVDPALSWFMLHGRSLFDQADRGGAIKPTKGWSHGYD